MWIDLSMAALSGASLAIVSSTHCAVMCGPLAAASNARTAGGSARYVLGRAVSYTLLGALAGSLGRTLLAVGPSKWAEAALSWAFALVLLGAAARQLAPRRAQGLVQLGRAPRKSPLGRLLARAAGDPLLLGLLTALLPCGALYAALMGAAAQGSALGGATAMATFAVVTSVALVGVAQLSRFVSLRRAGQRVLGGVLLVGAAVMAWRPIPMLRAGDGLPPCHRSAQMGAP